MNPNNSTEKWCVMIVDAMDAHPFYKNVWFRETAWEEIFYRIYNDNKNFGEITDYEGDLTNVDYEEIIEWVEENYDYEDKTELGMMTDKAYDAVVRVILEYYNTN